MSYCGEFPDGSLLHSGCSLSVGGHQSETTQAPTSGQEIDAGPAQHGGRREAGLKQEGIAAWPPASATLPLARFSSLEGGRFCHPPPLARCSSLEGGRFCHPPPGPLLVLGSRPLVPPHPRARERARQRPPSSLALVTWPALGKEASAGAALPRSCLFLLHRPRPERAQKLRVLAKKSTRQDIDHPLSSHPHRPGRDEQQAHHHQQDSVQ